MPREDSNLRFPGSEPGVLPVGRQGSRSGGSRTRVFEDISLAPETTRPRSVVGTGGIAPPPPLYQSGVQRLLDHVPRWLSRWGSNPRPLGCEPSALPLSHETSVTTRRLSLPSTAGDERHRVARHRSRRAVHLRPGLRRAISPFVVTWSDWLDSHQRSPAPQAGAMTRLRYSPSENGPTRNAESSV